MLDMASKHRMISIVVANNAEALQMTIHNYLCADYEANRDAYRAIERSPRWIGPGATGGR